MPQPGKPMVGWYDPGQLARTGVEVAISTIFGRASDYRMFEALTQSTDPYYDCTNCEEGKSAWIDYVADTGDGWNSTYAVAYWSAVPKLVVRTADGRINETTETGSVLIFGGDQVYPTASRSEYIERLIDPYASARKNSDEPYPEVYAVPGNHDWYDNLVSFTRLFCDKEWFAGWRTRQQRSYFVLQLPHGWWLVGTDVQLGSDIDAAQLRYFKAAAAHMKADDRIILCTAEPHWIFAELYREQDPNYYNEKSLSFLEKEEIFGDRIQIFLAGDLHHYRRHEGEQRRQKITSGGGGAFLHPTHGPDVTTLHQDLIEESEDGASTTTYHSTYVRQTTYPDEKTSRRLCWRNLLFPFLNPRFGVVPAFLYLLLSWAILAPIAEEPNAWRAFGKVFETTLQNAMATFLCVFVICAFIFFTETHWLLFRWLGGGIHALVHLAAAFVIGWRASYFVRVVFDVEPYKPPHLIVSGIVIFIAGWVVGSFLFGLYLLISLNLFKRHSNEAFSSLKIEDYKNFLRFRIDPDGGMTIFPIGIEKVPKKWKRSTGRGPKYEPDGAFTKPFLIEEPIRISSADLRRPSREPQRQTSPGGRLLIPSPS